MAPTSALVIPAPDGDARRPGFDGQGQRDPLVERAGDERPLAVARAAGHADGVRPEQRPVRLRDDVDEAAHAPGPRHQEAGLAPARVEAVEGAHLGGTMSAALGGHRERVEVDGRHPLGVDDRGVERRDAAVADDGRVGRAAARGEGGGGGERGGLAVGGRVHRDAGAGHRPRHRRRGGLGAESVRLGLLPDLFAAAGPLGLGGHLRSVELLEGIGKQGDGGEPARARQRGDRAARAVVLRRRDERRAGGAARVGTAGGGARGAAAPRVGAPAGGGAPGPGAARSGTVAAAATSARQAGNASRTEKGRSRSPGARAAVLPPSRRSRRALRSAGGGRPPVRRRPRRAAPRATRTARSGRRRRRAR